MIVLFFTLSPAWIFLILYAIIRFWPYTPDTFETTCSMCHVGKVTSTVSGSADQFYDTTKCPECGYEEHEIT
jgi:hypothetical protein